MSIDPVLLERWLDARDHLAMRRAWEALRAIRIPLGTAERQLTLHGAARLAEAMLGTRATWLLEPGPPVFSETRISDGAFLDHLWNVGEANQESLTIHEQRDGLRGVQLISISSGTITGRPEGGGVRAVRIVDRDRAAVVPIEAYVPEVATIGEVELAPLDLLVTSLHFPVSGTIDVAVARALIAQLLGEVDAHFDTSPEWPEGPSPGLGDWYGPSLASAQCFVAGPRAVSIALDTSNRLLAQAHGLPWGHRLSFQIDSSGYLMLRFPGAELDRISARLRALGTISGGVSWA